MLSPPVLRRGLAPLAAGDPPPLALLAAGVGVDVDAGRASPPLAPRRPARAPPCDSDGRSALASPALAPPLAAAAGGSSLAGGGVAGAAGAVGAGAAVAGAVAGAAAAGSSAGATGGVAPGASVVVAALAAGSTVGRVKRTTAMIAAAATTDTATAMPPYKRPFPERSGVLSAMMTGAARAEPRPTDGAPMLKRSSTFGATLGEAEAEDGPIPVAAASARMSMSPDPSPLAMPALAGVGREDALDEVLAVPVARAWRFESENRTEFSFRCPVIACCAETRGPLLCIGAEETTSSSPPPKGLASLDAKRSAPAEGSAACAWGSGS